jgi:hypothetical protein
MSTVSNPVVNITKAPASTTQSNAPQRVLIVGQQTGSFYTSGELIEDVGNANKEINLIGARAHGSYMIRNFKKINQETALDVIILDDSGTAVQSTGAITFTGTNATEDGTYIVYIGSRSDYKFTISVTDLDTPTIIGDALVAAVTANLNIPVTAANVAGAVTFTSENGGTIGNNIGLQSKGSVAGITVAVTAMSGGINDPLLTTVFDGITDMRYQTIIWPHTYDIPTLTTNFLDGRFNSDNDVLDGVGIISRTDTFSNIKTLGDDQNSQSLAIHANKLTSETLYKGSALFELDDAIAAQFGALRALRLTDGANISRFTVATGLDAIGGTRIASLPYHNSSFPFLSLVDTGKGFSKTEIKSLNTSGVFVLANNKSRTSVIADTVVSTYKFDGAGNPDPTWHFLNGVDTDSNVAEFFFNNSRADFAQTRLTDFATKPGENDAKTILSKYVEYYITLTGEDYMLTRDGQENINFFKKSMEPIVLDLIDGSASGQAQYPRMSQLRELNLELQPVFNI